MSGADASGWRTGSGLIAAAVAVAVALACLKAVVHLAGLEFISTLAVLTGLLGAVVFTLAILLQATIRDYKEAEQLVAELAAKLRRLYWDLRRISSAGTLDAMVAPLAALAVAVREDIAGDDQLDIEVLHGHIARIDEAVTAAGPQTMPLPQLRTVQVELIDLTRVLERLEVIIETEALQTGYRIGGAIVSLSLAGFLFADVGATLQASVLYGFAVFLLGGLFLLVRDLDNPFAGFVQVSTKGLDRVAEWLRRAADSAPT